MFGPASAAADLQALLEGAANTYRSILDTAVDSISGDVQVTKVIARVPAGPAIVEQVEAANRDLVVMGSRGRGDVKALLVGSVSHHVLHASRSAVLVAHAKSAV